MTSPSTSTTSGTLTTCTPSSSVDWLGSRGTVSQCFTAVNPMYTHKITRSQYDLEKTPNCGVHLKLAQRKGLQFYQTRSNAIALFNTSLAICLERVVYMKAGEEVYCKVSNLQRYREPYSRRIFFMDVRIFLIPKREHPRPLQQTKREVRGNSSHASRRNSWSEVRGDS